MFQETIINPKTGRKNRVCGWTIVTRTIHDKFVDGTYRTSRDLSLALLNDDEAIQKAEDEQYGESHKSNFALRVFEQALDWKLGVAICKVIDANIAAHGSVPSYLDVLANKRGDVFVRYKSGQIVVF